MNRRFNSLRMRFMLIILLAMLPVSILTLVHIIEDREKQISKIKKEGIGNLEQASASISQIVEGCMQLLLSLSYSKSFSADDLKEADMLLKDIRANTKYYLTMGVCSSDGLVLESVPPSPKKLYANDRLWFKRVKETGKFSGGEYQVGRITGKASIPFGCPVQSQTPGISGRSIFASLDLDILQENLKKSRPPVESVIMLVDSKGISLANNSGNNRLRGKPCKSFLEFKEKNIRQGEYFETTGTDGVRRLFTFISVNGSNDGIFAGIGLSFDRIIAESRKDMIFGLAWLGAITIAAFIITWLIAGISIVKHTRNLIGATKRLTAGDLKARSESVGGVIELRELSSSFNEMAETLEKKPDGT